jgi:hypothetical protein
MGEEKNANSSGATMLFNLVEYASSMAEVPGAQSRGVKNQAKERVCVLHMEGVSVAKWKDVTRGPKVKVYAMPTALPPSKTVVDMSYV